MIYSKLTMAAAVAASLCAPIPAFAAGGIASWYQSGHRTANGERFNPNGMTAAHRSLPFGTRILVQNPRTGRSAVVRINDRGPFIRGRVLDLSRGSARAIGMSGTQHVTWSVIGGRRYAEVDLDIE